MTPEELKDFETLFDLFSHPGWGIFNREMSAQYQSLRESAIELEESEFSQRKGYVYGLAYALNFETLIRNAYETKIEENDESL